MLKFLFIYIEYFFNNNRNIQLYSLCKELLRLGGWTCQTGCILMQQILHFSSIAWGQIYPSW